VFSCGSGFSATTVGITSHGNVLRFESPAGKEHIQVGTFQSGYGLCVNSSLKAFDIAHAESGWSGFVSTSQPNGPNTFPLEITRTTADGTFTVLRRFTGNSFVFPGGGPQDLNGNGQLCDTMAECGNCGNRTMHVLTRVTNNSGGSAGVAIIEAVDFDIAGSPSTNTWAHTSDSVLAFESANAIDGTTTTHFGMLLQAMVLPSNPSKYVFDAAFPGDCIGGTLGVDGTVVGDHDAYLLTSAGSIPNGGTTGANIRVHYRRF
jgi:hypothetical protein